MRPIGVSAGDGRDVRRYLRDLAALTALPAVWSRADRRQVAENLADVLVKVVDPDFVLVRFKASHTEDATEVARVGQESAGAQRERAIKDALEPWLLRDAADAAVTATPARRNTSSRTGAPADIRLMRRHP
jgi:hypothetical protein